MSKRARTFHAAPESVYSDVRTEQQVKLRFIIQLSENNIRYTFFVCF